MLWHVSEQLRVSPCRLPVALQLATYPEQPHRRGQEAGPLGTFDNFSHTCGSVRRLSAECYD